MVVILTATNYVTLNGNPKKTMDIGTFNPLVVWVNPAVVGVAYDVNKAGFWLHARNSDIKSGFACFNWMAVSETPNQTTESDYNIVLGSVQPKYFCAGGTRGDWIYKSVDLRHNFADIPVILTTENNVNVLHNNPAVVALLQNVTKNNFMFTARNSDNCDGDGGFNYVAILDSDEPVASSNAWIDTGKVHPFRFQPHSNSGDWNYWEIYFNKPFATPPIVLVTPYRDKECKGEDVAPVGIARNVTTHGFTLAARNSASGNPGDAGFYWVAFGCALSCFV